MTKRSNHWRTNLVATIAILLFIGAGACVAFGLATFAEASSFLSVVAIPLLVFGLRLSADSKTVENKFPN